MKKRISLFLALLVLLLTLVPMQAIAADDADVAVCEEGEQENAPRSDENIWYTRTINGVTQKRLWSITYRCWLTDWIDC